MKRQIEIDGKTYDRFPTIAHDGQICILALDGEIQDTLVAIKDLDTFAVVRVSKEIIGTQEVLKGEPIYNIHKFEYC